MSRFVLHTAHKDKATRVQDQHWLLQKSIDPTILLAFVNEFAYPSLRATAGNLTIHYKHESVLRPVHVLMGWVGGRGMVALCLENQSLFQMHLFYCIDKIQP